MRRSVFIKDNLNKHSVRAVIAAYEKHFPERSYTIIENKSFDISLLKPDDRVLFSSATRSVNRYIDIANAIKKTMPEINTIIGGAHATARADELINSFDAVLRYEGENIIRDIILNSDNDNVKGIFDGSKVEDLNEYKVFPRKIISLGPIEIIRGCPSRCAYCQTPQLFPGRLRYRTVDFICSEIEFALSRKGYADARFIAPDAASYYYNKGVNLDAIETLLSSVRTVLRGNGKIFFGTFPSELDPSDVTDELAELLVKYCDNKLIVLGLQSASEKMTKTMKRRSGVKETENAIEIFLKHDFEIVVDLIFGLPYEDESTYKETEQFIDKWRGKVTIHAHPYDSLPGSKWEYETPTEVPISLINKVKTLEGIGRVFGRVVENERCWKI